MIPFDPQPPVTTSGIRIGTAAVTTRGFKEDDCRQVATWIDEALTHGDDNARHRRIGQAIKEYMAGFPLYEA